MMELITTVAQIQEHAPVAGTFKVENFGANGGEEIERDVLKRDLFGETFWNEIVTAAGGSPTTQEAELIRRARAVIVKLGMALYAPTGSAQFHSADIVETRVKDFRSIPEWKMKHIINRRTAEGHAALNSLVEYMFDQVAQAQFTTWAISIEYAEISQLLIRRYKHFNDVLPGSVDSWTYYHLLPLFKSVQREQIKGSRW